MIDPYFWDSVEVAEGRHHIIPLADHIPHEATDDCVCGVTAHDLSKSLDPSMGTEEPLVLVQHRSLDNREQVERERTEAFFDRLRSFDERA